MLRTVRIYYKLQKANFYSRMEYKANFIFGFDATVFISVINVFGLWVILNRFRHLKGWNFWEVGFIYALWRLSRAVFQVFAGGAYGIDEIINKGELDRLLLRPAGTLTQILGSWLNVGYFGHLFGGVIVLGFIAAHLEIDWLAGKALLLPLAVISGAVIETNLIILFMIPAFWLQKSLALTGTMSEMGRQFMQYPLDIYNPLIQFLFTFIFPYGFMSYYPSHFFFGTSSQIIFGEWLAFISPLVALVLSVLVYFLWNFSIGFYRSSGT